MEERESGNLDAAAVAPPLISGSDARGKLTQSHSADSPKLFLILLSHKLNKLERTQNHRVKGTLGGSAAHGRPTGGIILHVFVFVVSEMEL